MSEVNDIIGLKEEYLQHPKDNKFKNLIPPGYSFEELNKNTLREAVCQAKGALENASSFLSGYKENYFQEIFQNANDAIRKANNDDKTCRMYFSKNGDLYTVKCIYKENGFTFADLFSLLKINSSGKSKEEGQIGTFGIGIKSLWVFAEQFSITSNIKVEFSYIENELNTSIEYAEQWDGETTQLSLSFRRNNDISNTINLNKLCDFIDLLFSDNPSSAEEYLTYNSWEKTLFDLRMLLFTSEKNGMNTLELHRNDETAPLFSATCSSTELDKVSVKTISVSCGNEDVSPRRYTLTRHSSPEHIVALKVPEDLTSDDIAGCYCKEPMYFADFFVCAYDFSPNLLVSCNSTDHSRSAMKIKPQIQYQEIITALTNAAISAKQNAKLDEADRFACTRALCGIAMSREVWLPDPAEGQEDNSDPAMTELNNIYVGTAGGKAIDVIYKYDSSPLDLKASSINNEVLECFGKLVASHLPSGTNTPVFYLPEDTRQGFVTDSKSTDSFPADNSESKSADELSKFLGSMTIKDNPILSEFPVAITLSDAVQLLNEDLKSGQIYNAIRGRAGETGFDIEGMPTKAAVIDYLIWGKKDDNEFQQQYGKLYQATKNALCTVFGVRRKRNSYFGYYFSECKSWAKNCVLDKDSLLKLASLLSFPEVQERLLVRGKTVMLAESTTGKNIGSSNGLFSPPYMNQKEENNNSNYVIMIDLSSLFPLPSLFPNDSNIEISFAEFRTLWERLFSLAEGYSKRPHYCYYHKEISYIPYIVISYFKRITYRITDISLIEYIDWLCHSADKLHDKKMSEDILKDIKVAVNGTTNAKSSLEYQDMTEFISRHLLAQTNIKEVVILAEETRKTISGSCGNGTLELHFSGEKTLKNSVTVEVDGEAEKGRLYIFTGSSRSNADLHGKIINALTDANGSLPSDKKTDDPRNFLKYFIHTGREYNVKSADFDILISGSRMGFGYLYKKLQENSYRSRIPSRNEILPIMVRTILCGRNSYDRHCPFCNGSFVSSIDGSDSEKELVTVIIPISSEKKFLPVIMCKDCYKRFMHVTNAKLEKSDLKLEVSISDDCRQSGYTVTVPLSPDNMALYQEFNK